MLPAALSTPLPMIYSLAHPAPLPCPTACRRASSTAAATTLAGQRQAITQWLDTPCPEELAVRLTQRAGDDLRTIPDALIAHHHQGLQYVMTWRRQVLGWLAGTPPQGVSEAPLKALDAALRACIVQAFGLSHVSLEHITLDSAASLLRFLVDNERVHPTSSIDSLGRKLGRNRRVLALTHTASTSKLPSAVVYIALVPHVAHSTHYLDMHSGQPSHVPGDCPIAGQHSAPEPTRPSSVATFYSVSVTDSALKGTGLATSLLLDAVEWLQLHEQPVQRFVTLSPVPRFLTWLRGVHDCLVAMPADTRLQEVGGSATEAALRAGSCHAPPPQGAPALLPGVSTAGGGTQALDTVLSMPWEAGEAAQLPASWRETLLDHQDMLLHLLRWHVCFAQSSARGAPLCPTAAFHSANGARLYSVNVLGDTSARALRESGTLMVNYEYTPPALPELAASFAADPAAAMREVWFTEWSQPSDRASADPEAEFGREHLPVLQRQSPVKHEG